MPRRLLRVAAAGFCLLSLLACLGVGWLWWRARHGYKDYVEASAAEVYARGGSVREGCFVYFVLRWPVPAFVRWESCRDTPEDPYVFDAEPDVQQWERLGLTGYSGHLRGSVSEGDGTPI